MGKHANPVYAAAEKVLFSRLNAFITPTLEAARAEAETEPDGPLAGVPMAIKDMIATAGVKTTAGSRILKDWVPRRDAAVVRLLQDAGAISVGKTNTHEFALGTTNDNPHYGATRNPWNPDLTTGGSSGGSAAAVAAGIVPLALGTDTAGSIRIPAALCGCVGFKPGWGVVPSGGVIPLARSLDHVGFLTDTVAMARRAFEACVGSGQSAAGSRSPVIGIYEKHAYDRAQPEIVAAIEQALTLLEGAGFTIRRIALPEFDDAADIGLPIARSESLAFHARWYPERGSEYGADVARALSMAGDITAQQYLLARKRRARLTRAANAMLEDIAIIAGPTVPIVAFPNSQAYEPVLAGGELPRFALTRLTYPFNLSRLPAISVPAGLSSGGLPIGLQLAAGAGREAMLLDVAEAFERISPMRGCTPRTF